MARPPKQQAASTGYRLGMCFYPEQWARVRWTHYATQMRTVGFTYVRVGDFTWSEVGFEPLQLPNGLRRISSPNQTIWPNFGDVPQTPPASLVLEPVSWSIETRQKE